MKISTKGRYGTRFMLELAISPKDRPVTIKEAAENQRISEKYLEQIIPSLKKSGLIRSIRGSQGGYVLDKAPEAISVGMILTALEGPLAPVDCVLHLDNRDSSAVAFCDNMPCCVTIDIWKKVYDAVHQVVDNITLADLAAQYRQKRSQIQSQIQSQNQSQSQSQNQN
jgi:Rrf2 family cysteine metabolism transcriptional repressor